MKMIKKTFNIKNKLGLHARPAALLAQTTSKFESRISLVKDGQEIDCKSILGIMMMAVEYGADIDIVIEGSDEKDALVKIEELINKKFYEE